MLNKEYYAKEIAEIVTSLENAKLAFNRHTKKPCKCVGFSCDDCLFENGCQKVRNKWANSEHIEPIKLTLAEKIILENLDSKFKWIARDKSDGLHCYALKPRKISDMWFGEYYCICPFNQLFSFIKWEDDEPYKIEDILNNCEVVKDD